MAAFLSFLNPWSGDQPEDSAISNSVSASSSTLSKTPVPGNHNGISGTPTSTAHPLQHKQREYTYKDFASKMQRPEAHPLVRKLRQFVLSFLRLVFLSPLFPTPLLRVSLDMTRIGFLMLPRFTPLQLCRRESESECLHPRSHR